MQKSEAKKQEPKLTGKATITGVLSADSIVIKQTGGEDPIDGIVHLAWIQAPRIGSSQRVEEPFAFDARECIREKIIGKKCTFI
jgi:staphylococcal nuclease domain-containing protein 1